MRRLSVSIVVLFLVLCVSSGVTKASDSVSCRTIPLSDIEWVASCNDDTNPGAPGNHAELIQGSGYHGMEWNSPELPDLSLNDLDSLDRTGISTIEVTLSASEPMTVIVGVKVQDAYCGKPYRVASADAIEIGPEPQSFTFPVSAFSGDAFEICTESTTDEALAGDALSRLESILVLPLTASGELRVHEVAFCDSDVPLLPGFPAGVVGDQIATNRPPLDWQMVLSEPGLTTYVLRCRFPEDSQDVVGLRFAQLNASAFEGIEFGAKIAPAAPMRVWIAYSEDSPTGGQETLRWASSPEPIEADPTSNAFRLAFNQFRVEDECSSSSSSSALAVDPAMIRGIYFQPVTSNAQLEISYLALYRYDAERTTITALVIDQFSLRSADKSGAWVVGSQETSDAMWRPIVETLLTTDAWQAAGVRQIGGTLEVVPDPTGSGHGLVCQVTVPPLVVDGVTLARSAPRIERRWQGIYVSRIYGGVYFPQHDPPCVTSIDVYLDDELVATAAETTSGTILLDVYDRCSDPTSAGCWVNRYGESNNSSLQAKLWTGSNLYGKIYLSLKYGDAGYLIAPLAKGAPPFTANEWHTISIAIYPDRSAALYQDGVLVARHALNRGMAGGTTGGHPGLYIHDSVSRGQYAVRGVFLYDNYRIQCGQELDIAAIIAEQAK